MLTIIFELQIIVEGFKISSMENQTHIDSYFAPPPAEAKVDVVEEKSIVETEFAYILSEMGKNQEKIDQKRLQLKDQFEKKCLIDGSSMHVIAEKLKRIKFLEQRLKELRSGTNKPDGSTISKPTEQEIKEALYRHNLRSDMFSTMPETSIQNLIAKDINSKYADEVQITNLQVEIHQLKAQNKALRMEVERILEIPPI